HITGIAADHVGHQYHGQQHAERLRQADQPDTTPRCPTGTWSGTPAVRLACIAFSPAWARHQPAMTPASVCWPASRHRRAPPAGAPPALRGRGPPNRLVVRPDGAPAPGLATTATAAPMPVTQPRTTTLCAAPEIACTWLGSRTAMGPTYPR